MASKNRHTFELRLGKLGLTLFVGGMSVLIFSMFLIGLVVGKHLEAYPDRYAQGILEIIGDRLFPSFQKSEKIVKTALETPDKHTAAEEEGSFGLTFYDTLGGKKTEVSSAMNEKSSLKTTPSGSPAQARASASLPAGAVKVIPSIPKKEAALEKEGLSEDQADASRGAKNLPPAMVQSSSPQKAALPTGKGHFEVQAAAYQERKRAEQMVRKFGALGFPSRIVVKEIPGKGTWYRVILDGFENKEKAQQTADKVAEKIRGLKCVVRPSGKNDNGG